MDQELIKSAATYGLGTVLAILMAGFMGWVIRFILKDNAKREERLAEIIERDLIAQKSALEAHDRRVSEATQRAEEAHRRQREEHEEMNRRQNATVQVLERIAGILAGLNPGGVKLVVTKEREDGHVG